MPRVILHADLNSFYAAVECLRDPSLRGLPMAVCGDPDLRHGIVLAKTEPARRYGVKTGETIWQAKQKCPSLLILKADHPQYLRFGRLAREILASYSTRVEPFGLDEAWVDVTRYPRLGDPATLADEIRTRIRDELGLTASIGISDNKIFAKLGSDMKKPDATTLIMQNDMRQKVWPLPVGELLYVGPATKRKLAHHGIFTIGDLARTDIGCLHAMLGKWASTLHAYANGLDTSPVAYLDEIPDVKSIGNSTTVPRDLTCDDDVRATVYMLCESVAMRLRDHGLSCRTVQLGIRDCELNTFERQMVLSRPSFLASELAQISLALFHANYHWERGIRSLGVRACDLLGVKGPEQLCFLPDEQKRQRQVSLERTIDDIRRRFGHFSLQRALLLADTSLCARNPRETHMTHSGM